MSSSRLEASPTTSLSTPIKRRNHTPFRKSLPIREKSFKEEIARIVSIIGSSFCFIIGTKYILPEEENDPQDLEEEIQDEGKSALEPKYEDDDESTDIIEEGPIQNRVSSAKKQQFSR